MVPYRGTSRIRTRPPAQDPTVAHNLGPYRGPRREAFPYARGTMQWGGIVSWTRQPCRNLIPASISFQHPPPLQKLSQGFQLSTHGEDIHRILTAIKSSLHFFLFLFIITLKPRVE